MTVATITAKVLGVSVERLPFRQLDVLDDIGRLVRLRIGYEDLAEIQQIVFESPEIKSLLDSKDIPAPLSPYLQKEIIAGSLELRGTLRRALMLIQVSLWKVNQATPKIGNPYLFMEDRTWSSAIRQYALEHGVQVILVPAPIIINSIIRRLLPQSVLTWLRTKRSRRNQNSQPVKVCQDNSGSPERHETVSGSASSTNPSNQQITNQTSSALNGSNAKIAVAYFGHLNLDRQELYSDIFFLEQSQLSGYDLIVAFSIPRDPLDEIKFSELKSRNIQPLVLHPGATAIPDVPLYKPESRLTTRQLDRLNVTCRTQNSKWLRTKIRDYESHRHYWSELFARNRVKAYVTWYKYDGSHFPIADAIQDQGGVMAIYQRSHETHPLADGTTYADIVFGFAPETAKVERLSNSIIRYHVTTGYLGDHRFSLRRSKANDQRISLQINCAERILAFFDENSGDDIRWHTGHKFMQQNYSFLLERLLNEPTLGLIFKPKSPGTLRRRLGPVAELLQRAETTGRCYVYEGGAMHGSHSPAEAALGADIAIHGHICAATAGLEASLAGVPTLLLDREGWPVSPLYGLGVGKVVFTDWQQMWEACETHWTNPESIEGFGDWSSMIDKLDPFRDGRSAERMGNYLSWILDGFKSGLDRETVMADAAERYSQAWGYDKVTEINGLHSWKDKQLTLN